MSDKTRKKFNATEQQLKDLLNGIKVAKPIVSLIKECGQKEREALILHVQIIIDSTNLQHLSAASDILRNNGIAENSEQKRLEEDIKKRYEELKQKEEVLNKEIKELNKEINEYLFYIEESFIWVTEDTLRNIVPQCISLCDEDDFLVLLFILFNRCLDECELMDNEELIFDSLKKDSNRAETIMKVNHNLDNLIIYIKQN